MGDEEEENDEIELQKYPKKQKKPLEKIMKKYGYSISFTVFCNLLAMIWLGDMMISFILLAIAYLNAIYLFYFCFITYQTPEQQSILVWEPKENNLIFFLFVFVYIQFFINKNP